MKRQSSSLIFQPVTTVRRSYRRIRENIHGELLIASSRNSISEWSLERQTDFDVVPDLYGGHKLVYIGRSIIDADTTLMEYKGWVLTQEEYKDKYNIKGVAPTYIIEVDIKGSKFYIDSGLYGNKSRFINHQCRDYNALYHAEINKHRYGMYIVACTAICPGDEILVDYGSSYFGPDRPCLCKYCQSPTEI